MIEVHIKINDEHLCHTECDFKGYTTLNDVALVLLELEKVKQHILDKSDDYEPIMEMKE